MTSWPGVAAPQPVAPATMPSFDPETMGQFMQLMQRMSGQPSGQASDPRAAPQGRVETNPPRGRASPRHRETSRSPSPQRRRLNRNPSNGSAGGDGGRRREPDDGKKLSNKYKFLGMLWRHGEDKITPKSFRVSLIIACDDERFQKVPLMLLQDEQVDLLIFVLGGIPPDMKVIDFGTSVRGEIRSLFRRTHKALLRQTPSRLDGMSASYDNLATVALRAGLPVEKLSPGLRSVCQAMRLGIQLGGANVAGAGDFVGEGDDQIEGTGGRIPCGSPEKGAWRQGLGRSHAPGRGNRGRQTAKHASVGHQRGCTHADEAPRGLGRHGHGWRC